MFIDRDNQHFEDRQEIHTSLDKVDIAHIAEQVYKSCEESPKEVFEYRVEYTPPYSFSWQYLEKLKSTLQSLVKGLSSLGQLDVLKAC